MPQASSTSAESAKIAQLEAQIADAKSSADNTWMLVSSALVLLMTGPGLALFYGGLVRKKNILSVMMQSFAMMSIITVLWAVLTYSLAFDSGTSFIGGLHHVFLRGVGLTPDPDLLRNHPLQTFMIYQLMFAIITPALITGAFAERMKFSAMCVLLTLWSIFVYSPDGPHGVGRGRTSQRYRDRHSHPGLRRRDGRPRHLRRLRSGLRAVPGKTAGLPQRAHGAALHGAQRRGSLPAVGRLVRL